MSIPVQMRILCPALATSSTGDERRGDEFYGDELRGDEFHGDEIRRDEAPR
jgi:hypothetical protein